VGRERGVETVLLPGVDGRPPSRAWPRCAIRRPPGHAVVGGVRLRPRQDLAAIGGLCRARVLLCIDAIQSLGCLPLDVVRDRVDFLSADGHKWLLSVEGCGVFYCARRRLKRCGRRWLAQRGRQPD
jgi:glutamate/tyrosine decarboxylase-like PLP-dependent enzyme